jgi:hypothetical protein
MRPCRFFLVLVAIVVVLLAMGYWLYTVDVL